MASVSFRRVGKNFGKVQVLKGVEFDIADGEFVVLVGPSGCGKSTLLRVLAGLEDADSGEVLIDGATVAHRDPKDRDISMVFQSYALYPHMTVRQNMGFALKLRKTPEADVERQVQRVAEILNISALLHRFPRELSGGQRQRVAMGRAIVRDPKVFLFDEPLSNLDAKLRVAMRAEIRAMHHRLKTTTVYVTHDQVEAMTMADRIVVMRDGVVDQIGTPLEVFDRPCNLFVAQFIGSPSMNVFRGKLVRANGGNHVEAGGNHWPVGHVVGVEDGAQVLYGIRPTDMVLSASRSSVQARVIVVEPTGAETEIMFEVADQNMMVVHHGRAAAAPGDQINLQVDASRAHLFDANHFGRLN